MVWGARPAGLGGAYAALSDDANGPYYNPAGTAGVSRPEVALSYASLFSGIKLYAGQDRTSIGLGSFSFVDRARSWGALGLYWNTFQSPGVYREDTMGLSWGLALGGSDGALRPSLAVGAGIKMLRHAYDLDPLSSADPVFKSGASKSAAGLDVGLQWEPMPHWYPGVRLAVVGRNVNGPDVGLAQEDRVPAEWRVAAVMEDSPLLTLTPTVEAVLRRGSTQVVGGLERWFMDGALGLRAGGGVQEVAGGLSYRFQSSGKMTLQMDYALSWPLYVDQTAGTHRLSLSIRFGAPEKGSGRFSSRGAGNSRLPL